MWRALGRAEDWLALVVLLAMAVLPLVEIAGRVGLGRGIPGSVPLVQHLTLVITFIGAALAARSERLLALATASLVPERVRPWARLLTGALGAMVGVVLAAASFDLVRVDREFGAKVAWGIPVWTVELVMPLSLLLVSARLVWRSSDLIPRRIAAAILALTPVLLRWVPEGAEKAWIAPIGLAILVGTLLGMPIFAAIGGLALLLFWQDLTPINSVPGEAYRLATSPMLPAIPLFTLGGFILAEGGSSRRLTDFFTAMFGWMPGGLAVVTTVVLAFFTPLTGASGITILSMGGLLLPILVRSRYPESTSIGLVTVSGSIGLLLPPSLPVILYAFYAEIEIERLFIGALLPGMVLIAAVAGWAAVSGWRAGAERTPFVLREALQAMWRAKWELLMPVIILTGIFGGWATLVEASALTVLYALLVECVIFRDLGIRRDLPRVFQESATLVGGFMIILSVALGFTSFLIFAQVPMTALAWVQAHIASKLLFLLALNILLIVVGALMDIYSATLVIVPLIAPLGAAYGVDPVHLGVIFLANMELGYLMPPMGENLFLSAYRFEKPLSRVYRSTLPYVLVLLAAVLLITYVPEVTLGPLRLSGK